MADQGYQLPPGYPGCLMVVSQAATEGSGLRLGFACHWDATREGTWSGIPVELLRALASQTSIVELPCTPLPLERQLLRVASARRSPTGGISPWKQSDAALRLVERRLANSSSMAAPRAVIQIHDLGVTDAPFFLVQDLSYDLVLRLLREGTAASLQFPLGRRRYLQLRDRQLRIYESAAGVVALSEWFARSLVADSGFPAERVHLIHPGSNLPEASSPPPSRVAGGNRLLFLGRDFLRKGGDLVVEAARALRAGGRPVVLTIAGPLAWPLPEEPPEWVRFIGPVGRHQLVDLYDDHDLFVMPSRFEAFGLVFVEALSRNLPCIAADHMAMPEIVEHGATGLLVPPGDVSALAAAIDAGLSSESLYAQTQQRAAAIRRRYSWNGSADTVIDAVDTWLGEGGQSR